MHDTDKQTVMGSHVLRRVIPLCIALVVAFFYLLFLGGMQFFAPSSVAGEKMRVWFSASGVVLALLLMGGLRFAPVALFVALIAGMWFNLPSSAMWFNLPSSAWFPIFLFAFIVISGYSLVSIVLQRYARFVLRMRSVRDLVWFVGVSFIIALVVGLLMDVCGFAAKLGDNNAWLSFWLSDALSIVCVTPALLIYGVYGIEVLTRGRVQVVGREWRSRMMRWVIEFGAQVAVLVVGVFVSKYVLSVDSLAFVLGVVPLVWGALRRGLPGVSLILLAFYALVLIVLPQSTGQSPWMLASFLGYALVGVFLGVVCGEHQRNSAVQGVLARAGALIAQALGQRELLEQIAHEVVPTFASWCVFDVIAHGEAVTRIAVCSEQLRGRFVGGEGDRFSAASHVEEGIARVLRGGRAEVFDDVGALSVPMRARGRIVGALSFMGDSPACCYDQVVLRFAEELACRTALALDTMQLSHESQRRLIEVTTMQHVARAINSSLRLHNVFRTVVEQLRSTCGYRLVSIFLLESERLVLQESIGYESTVATLPLERSVSGRVALTGQAAFVRDWREEPEFLMIAPGTRQAIIIPLKTGDEVVLGTLMVESTGVPALNDDDFTLLMLLADQISLAMVNARLFDNLRASEHRYRTVVSQAVDGILVADIDGNLLDVNARATALLGYQRDQLIRMRMMDLVAPPDETQALEALSVMQRTGRVFTSLRLRRRDGALLPVEVNAGGVEGGIVLAIVRDVSERQKLESQLRQAQKLEAIGRLANGIAHDFNNLLSSIMGYAALMMEDLPAGHPQREELGQIVLIAQRGAGLTRQLLAFGRPSDNEQLPIDLTKLTQEALRLLRPTIPSTITIMTDMDRQLWLVNADPAQLQQVIINLVVNARDALPEGGTIQISTSNMQTDDDFCARHPALRAGVYVRLSVSDDGIGMEEQVMARIFEPFFTTKEEGRGTGLGLAITQRIVQSHGGAIEVASQVGIGTTLSVFIPALVEEPSPEEEAPIDIPFGHDELILVVDDEAEIRLVGQRILERHGYRTIAAGNGRSAVETYRAYYPDIAAVVLDLTMPEMDGRAAFLELRSIDPDVPVLFCSGREPISLTEQLTMPGTAFIAKPYGLLDLTRTIAQLLRSGTHSSSH